MFERETGILFNREVAENTYLMALRSGEVAQAAKPGQFVMIRVRPGADPLLRRPFSICGIQGDDGVLILYRVVGQGTRIMSALETGQHLSLLGPLGRGFSVPPERTTSVLVGGGIGVAPLLFLAQAVKRSDRRLLVGYGRGTEVLPAGAVALETGEFQIATEDGSDGREGVATDLLADQIEKGDRKRLRIFACGPRPMLIRVAAMARENRIPCQVSLEAAMACGVGACQGCAIKASPGGDRPYLHVCTDGPVFPIEAVDWGSL